MLKHSREFRWLFGVNVLDAVANAYVAVWFAMKWVPHLDLGTVSGREIVGSAMAILTGFFLTYTYKNGTSKTWYSG